MKLRFDHTYSADQNFKFLKKLGEAGFILDKRKVEHPGKSFCKFIILPLVKNKKQYLEFVHVGKGGEKVKAGFSLSAVKKLASMAKKLNQKIPTHYHHKNYDWKKNSKARLPGWNFIMFPKHKSKIFTWITEYEPNKNRKNQKVEDSNHPNGVYRIVEFNMHLSPADIKLFKNLFGSPSGNQFCLPEGRIINFSRSKTSRMVSIVMATKNLKMLVQNYRWDRLVAYNGRPAVLIKNPNLKMWDVVILES